MANLTHDELYHATQGPPMMRLAPSDHDWRPRDLSLDCCDFAFAPRGVRIGTSARTRAGAIGTELAALHPVIEPVFVTDPGTEIFDAHSMDSRL